jgi:hypothetical protein
MGTISIFRAIFGKNKKKAAPAPQPVQQQTQQAPPQYR